MTPVNGVQNNVSIFWYLKQELTFHDQFSSRRIQFYLVYIFVSNLKYYCFDQILNDYCVPHLSHMFLGQSWSFISHSSGKDVVPCVQKEVLSSCNGCEGQHFLSWNVWLLRFRVYRNPLLNKPMCVISDVEYMWCGIYLEYHRGHVVSYVPDLSMISSRCFLCVLPGAMFYEVPGAFVAKWNLFKILLPIYTEITGIL